MKRVPDDFCQAPDQVAVDRDECSLIWYTVCPPPPPSRFFVRQPTLSFVRSGLKHLQPHGAQAPVVAAAGTVVAMAAGVHVMTELTGSDERFASTIVSVSPALLRTLLGASDGPQNRVPVATAKVPAAVLDLLALPVDGAAADLRAREAVLLAARDPQVRALLFAEAARWGAEDEARLRGIMQEHCFSPLSLPEYAALAAMSLATFKRKFRVVFGEAPGRWLAQARLHYARWLLLVEQASVTEACFASGFGDLSNFIRAFRRRFGLAPRAYRAAHPDLVLEPAGPHFGVCS